MLIVHMYSLFLLPCTDTSLLSDNTLLCISTRQYLSILYFYSLSLHMYFYSPISPLSLNSGSPTGLTHLNSSLDHCVACSLVTLSELAMRPEWEWMRPEREWDRPLEKPDLTLDSLPLEVLCFPILSDDLKTQSEQGLFNKVSISL